MALEPKKWKEILSEIETSNNSSDILGQIKEKLQEQDKDAYEKWEQEGFDINYQFTIGNSFTKDIDNQNVAQALSIIIEGSFLDVKYTLLNVATKYNSQNVIQALLSKGAKVSKEDLFHAIEKSNSEIVSALLNAPGIDVNKGSGLFEQTPLGFAIKKGNLDIVQALLGVEGIEINKTNGFKTPLLQAVEKDRLDIVKALLKVKGIDVNARNSEGQTLLHFAAHNGNLEIAQALLGAQGIDVNAKDSEGYTPLYFAIDKDNSDIVQALLETARKPSILKDVLTAANTFMKVLRGKVVTPFTFAIEHGSHKSIKVILDTAKENNILEDVLTGIKEDDREKLKTILRNAGDNGMLGEVYQVETSMAVDKAVKTGVVLGVMTALAVGIGCGVAGTQLSILSIAGIALTAAVAVGLAAGGVTYFALRPSTQVSETQKPQNVNPGCCPAA